IHGNKQILLWNYGYLHSQPLPNHWHFHRNHLWTAPVWPFQTAQRLAYRKTICCVQSRCWDSHSPTIFPSLLSSPRRMTSRTRKLLIVLINASSYYLLYKHSFYLPCALINAMRAYNSAIQDVSSNHFGFFFSSFRPVQSAYGSPTSSRACTHAQSARSITASTYFVFLSISYNS